MNKALAASERPLDIAVIGSGISGLSAAWLLSRRHRVTLFEADARVGGHSHTVDAGAQPVDTGFIVYNEATYPNLAALFNHVGAATKPSEMTFAVSLDAGRLEYSGTDFAGLFAQRRNLVSPRFWTMLAELVRFYRRAANDVAGLGMISLDEYLDRQGFGRAFRDDHLYPMAAAIWSTPACAVGDYPAAAFIRFCENHGLLRLGRRPEWRTVAGGAREYVRRLTRDFEDRIETGSPIMRLNRDGDGVEVVDARGNRRRFEQVVVAAHADQALAMLDEPSPDERRLLGAFGYSRHEAVLHRDPTLMPNRRAVWSSWNYLTRRTDEGRKLSVTYWMNRLQGIPEANPLFVTLNPCARLRDELVIKRQTYEHPTFDHAAISAQDELWSLQGHRNTWFCGAYFGAGFHEDGLQAGLAVAEQLGGVRRPWAVRGESDRIRVRPGLLPGLVPA